MIKVLKFMNIKYEELFSTLNNSVKLKYKEKSNVLSYYIITNILMFNYQLFLSWCVDTNGTNKFMFFRKNIDSQNKMCLFVKTHCMTQIFLDSVDCMETTIDELKDLHYNIKNNLRMTICELE